MAEDGLCSQCKDICSNLRNGLFDPAHNFLDLCRFLKGNITSYPESWHIERLAIKDLSAISGYEEGKRRKTSHTLPACEETKYCWSFKPRQEAARSGVGRCVLCHLVEQLAKHSIVAKQEFLNSKVERYQLRSYVFGISGSYWNSAGLVQKSLALSIVYRRPELPAEQEKALVCIRVKPSTLPHPGDRQIRPLKADIGRFRNWLQFCEKNDQIFCAPVLQHDNLNYRLYRRHKAVHR